MFDLPFVNRNQMPSAEAMNDLVRRVNRLSVGPALIMPTGMEAIDVPEIRTLDLYQVTQDPKIDPDSQEYYVKGNPVVVKYCHVDEHKHWVSDGLQDGTTKPRARMLPADPQPTLWIVCGPRDPDTQLPLSKPAVNDGDRVFVTEWWGIWIVVAVVPSDVTAFELIDRSGDGFGSAKPLKTDWSDVDLDAASVQIHDVTQSIYAVGRTDMQDWDEDAHGARGLYKTVNGKNMILIMEQVGFLFLAENVHAVSPDDGGYAIKNLRPLAGGQTPPPPNEDGTWNCNNFGWSASGSTTHIVARLTDSTNDFFVFLQGPCLPLPC